MDLVIRPKLLLDHSPCGDEVDQLEDASTIENHDEGLETDGAAFLSSKIAQEDGSGAELVRDVADS